MNKLNFFLLLFICLSTQLFSNKLDSLGLKKENNKTYIVYKIAPKQTLFSVLKRYNLSLTEFKQVNPETDIPVKPGEIVYIPLHYLEESPSILKNIDKPVAASEPEGKEKETQKTSTENSNNDNIHIVLPKQGLLTIANQYKVTMAQLRKWNNLKSDRLQEGQRLIIKEPAIEPVTLAPTLPAKPEKKIEGKIDTSIPAENSAKSAENTSTSGSEGIKKTIETGIAELIDVPDNSGKYLALHKSAPIGTLVLVKNLANNQSIWVKVVGRLPNSDPKVVIKISPKAFEKLNAVDKRIRAEISYLIQ